MGTIPRRGRATRVGSEASLTPYNPFPKQFFIFKGA